MASARAQRAREREGWLNPAGAGARAASASRAYTARVRFLPVVVPARSGAPKPHQGWRAAHLVRPLLTGLLTAAALLLPTRALALGSVQIVAAVDQNPVFINGAPALLQNPPRVLAGRTLLPLRETAALLGQPLGATGSALTLGRLSVDARGPVATLSGVPQEGAAANVSGVLYVSARTLSDALGGNISFSDDARTLTLTVLPPGSGNPLTPQARFSTDKEVYAPGERIVYTEYSFDPDGGDLTARRWTNRQDTFFTPGTYTVSLQVTNAKGLASSPYSRTIQVTGAASDTPLTYALKYAQPGDIFSDPALTAYPVLNPQTLTPTVSTLPLIFSDSPEAPTTSGILYQDTVAGRARVLAYHLNALPTAARLYLLARNTETRPVEVRTERSGETAPTRVEGVLGQATLLDYFAPSLGGRLTLAPGEYAAVYASPTLPTGSGVNLMQDLESTGRVELSVVMLEDSLPPTAQVVQQLTYLPPDGRHQRGTFPGAVRSLRVELGQLPARLVIGDGSVDPVLTGTDVLTGTPQRLAGNYGVLYDLQVIGTAGTAVALSPRGGLYRGAMSIQDGSVTQAIKLPRAGVLTRPDQPALLWRVQSPQLNIDFVPASGSFLPVNLLFYRAAPGTPLGVGNVKTYNP